MRKRTIDRSNFDAAKRSKWESGDAARNAAANAAHGEWMQSRVDEGRRQDEAARRQRFNPTDVQMLTDDRLLIRDAELRTAAAHRERERLQQVRNVYGQLVRAGTELAHELGISAHELRTIVPAEEQARIREEAIEDASNLTVGGKNALMRTLSPDLYPQQRGEV